MFLVEGGEIDANIKHVARDMSVTPAAKFYIGKKHTCTYCPCVGTVYNLLNGRTHWRLGWT